MIRRVLGAGLALLGVVAGCAQIAGLGDAPSTLGTACGIAVNGGSCSECLAAQCCTAAHACATTPGCSIYEDCLMPCGSDYACRAKCFQEHPPSAPEAADLDQCIASRCNDECGLQCGMADTYAQPDAAPSCSECLATWACSEAKTCFDDPSCVRLAMCSATEPTLDRIFACANGGGDAGASEFGAFLLAGQAKCLSDCHIGANWSCAGTFVAPLPSGGTAVTLDVSGDQPELHPLPGATVKACPAGDFTCQGVLSQAVTDDRGRAQLTVPSGGALGLGGYFEMSKPPDYVTMLQFMEFPLSVPALTFGDTPPTVSEMLADYASAGAAAPDDTHGDVFIFAMDCSWTPAAGVQVDLSNKDEKTVVYYGTPSARATSFPAIVQILDVPQGPNTVRMTVPGRGIVADGISILVRPRTRSLVTIHPK